MQENRSEQHTATAEHLTMGEGLLPYVREDVSDNTLEALMHLFLTKLET